MSESSFGVFRMSGFLFVAAFGLAIGFTDLLAAMWRAPGVFTTLDHIGPPLAVSIVLGGAGFIVTYLVLIAPLYGILGGDRREWAAAWAVFLFCGFALCMFTGILPPSVSVELGYDNLETYIGYGALILAISFFAAVGGYALLSRLKAGFLGSFVPAMGLSVPIVLGECVLLLYLKDRQTFTFDETSLIVVGIVVAGTLVSVTMLRIVHAAGMIHGTLALALVVLPFALPVYNHFFERLPWDKSDAPPPVANVVLISIDSLRADALSCIDSSQARTPYIDGLAKNSILFTRAQAPAPWSLASVASLHTGLHPNVHGATQPGGAIRDGVKTLAQRFSDAGYYTGAVGDNPNLWAASGLDQGFNDYDWYPRQRVNRTAGGSVLSRVWPQRFRWNSDSATLTDHANAWLEKHSEKPFFFWMHYWDPHSPWTPPEEYLGGLKPSPLLGTAVAQETVTQIRNGTLLVDAEERQWLHALYDREARYVDAQVGRVIQQLKDLNLYDNALIILTSDHGDEFFENTPPRLGHGYSLYQETLHVPLMVKLPGSPKRGTREQFVSIGDVMPTVLELCGIGFDGDALNYRSLKPLLGEPNQVWEDRPLYSGHTIYFEPHEGVLMGGIKYMRFQTTGREELYDLNGDPQEQNNLFFSRPDLAQYARQLIQKQDAADRGLIRRLELTAPKEDTPSDEGLMEKLTSAGEL